MEKITALVFHKAKNNFLLALQEMGVIHIVLQKTEISDESVLEMGKKIERGKVFLRQAQKNKVKLQDKAKVDIRVPAGNDAFFYVETHERLKDELAQLSESTQRLEREIKNISIWGKFDISTIKKLREAGIKTRFFIASLKQFKNFDLDKIHYQEISRTSAHVYFVVFQTEKRIDLGCEEFFYPDTDMNKLEQSHASQKRLKIEKENILCSLYEYAQRVEKYLNVLQTSYSYATISSGVAPAAENSVYVVNGWLPRENKNKVERFMQKEDAYFYFSKPEVDEKVPVLLKNNRFVRLFEPITRLFDLPSYAELDLTAFFAPFFTLFFGFCLGDAGYGLIIFALAMLFRNKIAPNKKPIASLLAILGASTFFFGLISGTFFGTDLSAMRGVEKIVLFNQDRLFNVALILGVIQVLFGMGLKASTRIRQYGFLAGLSTFGWIILLLGIIGIIFLKTSIWVVYFGIALILLFNDLKANIFVRIGKGLWELYGITGIFGDVLSYIRLFALGISSSILGFVVNEIALQCRGIPYVGFFVTLLILVVGHAGNLALSALSSFVHPLRLTFVEFYKSAGFQGGGKAYNPFKKIG
ncbi:V-type ATP synthase subunit I [Candidatus Omnitrophota bacterium]